MKPILIFSKGELSGQKINLDSRKSLILGRSFDADLKVLDPLISKKHFEISLEDGSYLLADLGSSNGTLLNGSRVVDPVELSPGDIISAGGLSCEFIGAEKPDSRKMKALLSERDDFTPIDVMSKSPDSVLKRRGRKGVGGGSTTSYISALEILREIFGSIDISQDRQKVLINACAIIRQFFLPDRVIIFGSGSDGELTPLAVSAGKTQPEDDFIAPALHLVRNSAMKNLSLRGNDLLGDEGRQGAGGKARIRVGMCAPVSTGEKPWGVIYMDKVVISSPPSGSTITVPPVFTENEFTLITLIGREFGYAVEKNALIEEKLRSERRYRCIVENTKDVIISLDRGFRVTFMNSPGREIFTDAGGNGQAGSLPEWPCIRNGKEVEEKLNECASTGIPSSFRLLIPQSDGPVRVFRMNAYKTGGDGNNDMQILCMGYDVTKEQEMQKMMQRLEQLSALGETISGVAHELNNPLMAVLGFAELVSKNPEIPREMEQSFKIIKSEAERASKIVKNLLAFARMQKPEKTMLSVNQLVEQVLNLRGYHLKSNKITVDTQLDSGVPPVLADQSQLLQVFMNIVNNAQQAMENSEGPRRLLISTGFSGGRVRISFADTGRGISEKNMAKIFRPFFTTKDVGKGTGLGLSVSFGIVAEHDGTITVSSEEGKGAVFTVEIPPMKAGDEENKAADKDGPPTNRFKVQECHALIIDDEQSNCYLFREFLNKLKVDSYFLTDSRAAVEHILKRKPFLVISDLRMPHKSGMDIFRDVTAADPGFAGRFIFATGDTLSPGIKDFLDSSGELFIEKPFTFENFKKKIQEFYSRQGVVA